MKQKSKFLSFVLRHQPHEIGLELDAAGWACVDTLLTKAAAHGTQISRAELEEIVATSDKKRFTLSDDGTRIRAAQGHSVAVDLGLTPVKPPKVLFHGTATKALDAIRREGLRPQSRQQVHLSADEATARTVGQRHGVPHILRVAADQMQAHGFAFYQADNGVWLTDQVPPEFLT